MFAVVDGEAHDSRWPVPPYTLATVALATQLDTCTVDCDYQRPTCIILQQHGLEDIHTTKQNKTDKIFKLYPMRVKLYILQRDLLVINFYIK